MSLIKKIDWYFSLMIRAIIMEWALGWNTIILKNKKEKKRKKKKKSYIYDVYHKLQNIEFK